MILDSKKSVVLNLGYKIDYEEHTMLSDTSGKAKRPITLK